MCTLHMCILKAAIHEIIQIHNQNVNILENKIYFLLNNKIILYGKINGYFINQNLLHYVLLYLEISHAHTAFSKSRIYRLSAFDISSRCKYNYEHVE